MNASDRDLRELAFSTRSRILETVDSPNSFVVRIFSTPVMSMQPLMISSPSLHVARQALTGQRAGVQAWHCRSTTTPSMRHLLARLHDDDAADLNLIRVDLLKLSVPLDVGVIRAGYPSGAEMFLRLLPTA